MENPGFYAILPASVRYDNRLKPAEKIFYAEITALANQAGYCYAGNSYFSQLYGVDERTVRRWVQHLQQYGYADVSYAREGNDNQRRISPLTGSVPDVFDSAEIPDTDVQSGHPVSGADMNVRPTRTSMSATPGHKCPHNNTRDNNTRDNNTGAGARASAAEILSAAFPADERLTKILLDFVEFRKSGKHPMTAKAAQLICTKLNKLADEANVQDRSGYMVAVLEQSILRGWEGLFAVKEDFVDHAPAVHPANTEDCPREITPDSNILDFL